MKLGSITQEDFLAIQNYFDNNGIIPDNEAETILADNILDLFVTDEKFRQIFDYTTTEIKKINTGLSSSEEIYDAVLHKVASELNNIDWDEELEVEDFDAEPQQIVTQQYIQQAIEQAQVANEYVEQTETDKAAARRMNITEDQLLKLRSIPEKTRLSLKTPQSTIDRSGKRAKSKVIKMVSFNEKFEKGIVFLEYPHLKGWLVFSMGASEFFRKVNIRL